MHITITGRTIARIGTFIAAVAILTAAVVLVPRLFRDDLPDGAKAGPYQAVTLITGQQVFGDVQPPRDGYIEVRKAHRLQQEPPASKGQQPVTQVVPVTSDATEPRSSLFIAVDQVLAIQPLRNDSVIEGIIDGSSAKQPQATPGATTPTPTPTPTPDAKSDAQPDAKPAADTANDSS